MSLPFAYMQKTLKTLVRNFLIITIAIIAFAVILKNSESARETLSPPGLEAPPGVR